MYIHLIAYIPKINQLYRLPCDIMAGRPTVDLDAIKPEIVQMFYEGRPYASIASNIGVSEYTIRRCIQS